MSNFRGAGGRFVSPPEKRGIMIDALTPGIADYSARLAADVNAVMYQVSQEMEQWAQLHAPWQDRTGDARAGITTAMEESLEEPKIYIYHTVSYGLWLEIRWSGKFAIIMPTVERFGPELMLRIEAVI